MEKQDKKVNELMVAIKSVADGYVDTSSLKKDMTKFKIILEPLPALISKASGIGDVLPNEVEKQKMAKDIRIAIRSIRTSTEKTKGEIKKPLLKQTNAIDEFFRILINLLSPIEADLLEKEKVKERHEAAIREKKQENRYNELAKFEYSLDPGAEDLASLSEADFNIKLQKQKEWAKYHARTKELGNERRQKMIEFVKNKDIYIAYTNSELGSMDDKEWETLHNSFKKENEANTAAANFVAVSSAAAESAISVDDAAKNVFFMADAIDEAGDGVDYENIDENSKPIDEKKELNRLSESASKHFKREILFHFIPSSQKQKGNIGKTIAGVLEVNHYDVFINTDCIYVDYTAKDFFIRVSTKNINVFKTTT